MLLIIRWVLVVYDFAFLVKVNETIAFWYLFLSSIINFVSVSWRFYCTGWTGLVVYLEATTR